MLQMETEFDLQWSFWYVACTGTQIFLSLEDKLIAK